MHPASVAASQEPRWQKIACFVLYLVAIQVALGQKIQISQWYLSAEKNPCVAEGAAWLDGRLDLPNQGKDPANQRLHDTAYFNGKVYNAYPPLITFLTVLTAPINRPLMGTAAIWQPLLAQLLLFWPVVVLAYLVFSRETGSSAWGAVLAFAYLGGTAMLVSLNHSRDGERSQVLHVASQTGLFLILWDVLGKRRIWPALVGLMIATWSRQLTIFYALPILWSALSGPSQRRTLRTAGVLAAVILIIAPMLVLNHLKFGDAFETGYRHFYANRGSGYLEDRFRAHGLFSWHFVPENLYYSYLAPPSLDFQPDGVHISETNSIGTSAFITTPLLLWAIIACGRWWKCPDRRMLMLATLPIIAGLALYHGMGYHEPGYFRFALDFIPVWLAVAAPWMFNPWSNDTPTSAGHPRRWPVWLSLACIAWSVLYFNTITPHAYVDVEVVRPHP